MAELVGFLVGGFVVAYVAYALVQLFLVATER